MRSGSGLHRLMTTGRDGRRRRQAGPFGGPAAPAPPDLRPNDEIRPQRADALFQVIAAVFGVPEKRPRTAGAAPQGTAGVGVPARRYRGIGRPEVGARWMKLFQLLPRRFAAQRAQQRQVVGTRCGRHRLPTRPPQRCAVSATGLGCRLGRKGLQFGVAYLVLGRHGWVIAQWRDAGECMPIPAQGGPAEVRASSANATAPPALAPYGCSGCCALPLPRSWK